jgi:hypothetical protein
MEPSDAVSLRLITDLNAMLDHHCSLCLYFHDSTTSECSHKAPDGGGGETARPQSRFSDLSFYSAHTSKTSSTASSTKTVKATVSVTAEPKRQPFLRRKTSPTEISLRELRALHQRQSVLRAKQSDERLQQLYEEQILEYLSSPDHEFGIVGE